MDICALPENISKIIWNSNLTEGPIFLFAKSTNY